MFDEANIFVRNSDLSRLTGLKETEAHEIAILLNKNENTEEATKTISELLSKPRGKRLAATES